MASPPPAPTSFDLVEIGSDGKPTFSPVWLQWFLQIAKLATAGGNGDGNPVVLPSVGASPWTYKNQSQYDQSIYLTGGTISNVQVSRDGSTFYSGGRAGLIAYLSPGDEVKITYTAAPTIAAFPT